MLHKSSEKLGEVSSKKGGTVASNYVKGEQRLKSYFTFRLLLYKKSLTIRKAGDSANVWGDDG